MKEILWWILVTIFGIGAEVGIKGIGPFIPALLLCLQLEKIGASIFLAIFWMIIQEGGGNIPFGSVLLWYMGMAFVFFWLKNYLSSNGIIFVILMSVCSALWYFISIYTLTSLEEITIKQDILFHNSLIQLIAFPILWKFYSYIYQRFIFSKNQQIF